MIYSHTTITLLKQHKMDILELGIKLSNVHIFLINQNSEYNMHFIHKTKTFPPNPLLIPFLFSSTNVLLANLSHLKLLYNFLKLTRPIYTNSKLDLSILTHLKLSTSP